MDTDYEKKRIKLAYIFYNIALICKKYRSWDYTFLKLKNLVENRINSLIVLMYLYYWAKMNKLTSKTNGKIIEKFYKFK